MTPEKLASFPFFSNLEPAALQALAERIQAYDLQPNTTIIREGDAATAMYLLVHGSARVVRGTSGECLSVLQAPTLFGEMAIVASTPRLASVVAEEYCVIFEVTCDVVNEVVQQHPSIHATILALHRDRLMQNLLSSNSLFAPIPNDRKAKLAASFVTQTIAEGQVLLQQGQPGAGLFVLLRGTCEVWRQTEDQTLKLAELSEGSIFGEISLVLFDRLCTATVTTVSECVVLWLSRQDFQSSMMSDATVREEVIKLALERMRKTRQAEGDHSVDGAVSSARVSLL